MLFTIWSGSLATARIAGGVSGDGRKKKCLTRGSTRAGPQPGTSSTLGLALLCGKSLSMSHASSNRRNLEGAGRSANRRRRLGPIRAGTGERNDGLYSQRGCPSCCSCWMGGPENGREEPLAAESRGYSSVKIPPDGTRIALEVENEESLEDVERVRRGSRNNQPADA